MVGASEDFTWDTKKGDATGSEVLVFLVLEGLDGVILPSGAALSDKGFGTEVSIGANVGKLTACHD